MKEKIARLAKGIIEEDPPIALITPESFEETVYANRKQSFVIEIESLGGRNLKGVCFCDEYRIEFQTASFMGRMSHLNFFVDASGLPEGFVLSGKITILSNAGEFTLPYCFTVVSETESLQTEERREEACGTEDGGVLPGAVFAARKPELRTNTDEQKITKQSDPEAKFLAEHIPEDEDLLLDVTALLIRDQREDPLAFAVYRKAIEHGLEVTHLYESFMAAWPDDSPEKLPRQVLLYYLYEKDPDLVAADKLYSNIIRFEPENSEFYRQMEARMRDHALKSVLDRRINSHLSVIYNRMIYPEILDPKTAGIVPDLVRSHRIRTDGSAAIVHVQYPELKKTFSGRFDRGTAYIPVYFKNALITLHRADGALIPDAKFTNEALMSRPDLMRRCFALDPYHPMLLLSAAREITGRGVRSEEEKQILTNALTELDLNEEFRQNLIRTLCSAGGNTDWLDKIPLSDLDAEAGSFAFRAFLNSGRRREAYLYLRSRGMEFFEPEDLLTLADGLLENGEKPVVKGTETDRFFLCLCKYLADRTALTPRIMEFLTEEYEGATADMAKILKEADRAGAQVHALPERALTAMLFTDNSRDIDDVFLIYLKEQEQKELLLRAFFVVRMTDYFERCSQLVDEGVFEALESFFRVTRFPEEQPEILMIGLTRHYVDKAKLNNAQLDLCQKLTDILVSKELIFSYTKALRKIIRIPRSVFEKFYVDYMGTKESRPRMEGRILPEEKEYTPMNMKQVFHHVYVASTVLFLNEKLCYRLYDDAVTQEPVSEGSIEVRKIHGKEEDRYLWLNRMTWELNERNVEGLKEDMMKYAVNTEVNRELFGIGEE